MLEVPEVVCNKANAVGAERWLADLPELVAEVADAWQLTVGAPFPDGTEAYVTAVTLADATPAVLKLCIPRHLQAARREILTLRLAAGEGCVALLRDDVDRGALLLERLGPSLADLALSLDQRTAILVEVAARVWRPVPDADLPTGAAKARDLAAYIVRMWEETGRPCGEAAVAHALACAGRRAAAHDDERAVLVHGDVHQWNALGPLDGDGSGDLGFRLVDPDGLLAEPECDLGVLMREDPVELMAGDPWDRAHALAAATRTDATAIWEWGVAERVSTGLLCERIGLQPVGRQMLAAADVIAAASPGREETRRP